MNREDMPHGRRRSLLIFVAGMVATALGVGLIMATLSSASNSNEIRMTQEDAVKTIDNTERVLQRIRNCTTPGRPCYDRGQRQTAEAVESINRVIVLAASCSAGPDVRTESEIEACVREKLNS